MAIAERERTLVREFSPIICQQCGNETMPTSSKQKYCKTCVSEVKIIRHRERYRKDLRFRNRILELNRESSRRRGRRVRRSSDSKDPVRAKKWGITRLQHEMEDTAVELRRRKTLGLVPLFRIDKSEVIVYFSPKGYLCLRPGREAEFRFDAQAAVDVYGYKKVSQELKKLSPPGLKK